MASNGKKISSEEQFLSLFKEGRKLLDEGKVEEAKNILEKAYRLSPGSEGVENLLGMIYFRIDDYLNAETIYKRLLKRNPNNLTLRVNLGLIYFKTEKYFDAIRELNEALNIKPNYDKAHNYLGLVYAELGKYKTAREEFLRAGSRSMAKKMESIIDGVMKPDFYKKEMQKSKEEKEESPQGIQIGNLSLDPELKEMLDSFEKGEKDEEKGAKSKVEHIHLDVGQDGLVEAMGEATVVEESAGTSEGKGKRPASPKAPKEEKEPKKAEAAERSKFTITPKNHLEIVFSGHTFARGGGIITAEGNLDFEATKKTQRGKPTQDNLGGEENQIMKIKGEGKVLITPGDQRISITKVGPDEIYYVKESAILAFESGLYWENGSIRLTKERELDILQLKGKGDFAVLSKTDLVVKEIAEGSPFKVNVGAIIGWQGKIIPKVVNISQKGDEDKKGNIPFIEFAGKGRVIIE